MPRKQVYVNDMCLRMFGFESLEEAMSVRPISRLRNPEDREAFIESLKQTGRISSFEAECVTKSGGSMFAIFSATMESDVITGIVMDITQRKLADAALLDTKMRLDDTQRIAGLGSWDLDITTGALYWSDEVYRIFGLAPEEFESTYEAFLSAIHPHDRAAVEEAFNAALAEPSKPYESEHRVVLSDGSERIVEERGKVCLNEDGKPVRMLGTVLDVTRLKQTEKALKEALEEIKSYNERLEAENIYLRKEVKSEENSKGIVGASDSIKYVMNRIGQVARMKTTVLLTGETGTGKDVFARLLHRESDRRDKPLVTVNCASLPVNLIESELFGREKGAFTGSTARQIGRFELADRGTIFLDEIGELPIELQAKLLRVLESGDFERLGSPHTVTVDVRVIASTNRNLEEESRKGRFRKDLFYRLNAFPLTIPPLRQRKEDIPPLVEFYVRQFSRRMGKHIEKIPKAAMKDLEAYSWPGNVRELVNIIERAVILSNGPELRLAEPLSESITDSAPENSPEIRKAQPLKNLIEVERDHILQTLRQTRWKIEGQRGAAQILCMNPSTLRSRMRKLDIRRPSTA